MNPSVAASLSKRAFDVASVLWSMTDTKHVAKVKVFRQFDSLVMSMTKPQKVIEYFDLRLHALLAVGGDKGDLK